MAQGSSEVKALVTGGAGFIGRWVVRQFAGSGIEVTVLDDLSSGTRDNLRELGGSPHLKSLLIGDVRDKALVRQSFGHGFDVCVHLAAKVNVQESIDNPTLHYDVNVNGTMNVLEEARRSHTKVVLVSTCMVYEAAQVKSAIDENWPVKPASPYAGAKLASELMGQSYYHAYGLPVVVARPFNTYGPYQKSDLEGGVVSIFVGNTLNGRDLLVYGDGKQTRDFLYAEDCADFIVRCSLMDEANGEVINAGSGSDISIRDLAILVSGSDDARRVRHVPHHHPQSEVQKLLCDYGKARRLLGWEPSTSLAVGISKLRDFMKGHAV
jgi:UDP-glucose 4-epimerase